MSKRKRTYLEILQRNDYNAWLASNGCYIISDNFGITVPIPAEQYEVEIMDVWKQMQSEGWEWVDVIQSFLRENTELYICYN